MARFKVGKLQQKKMGWSETIIERIHSGKVLPVIGNSIANEILFGSHEDIVEGWAEYIDYPRANKHQLTQVTQFTSIILKGDDEIKADDVYIKEVYLDFLKQAVSSMADEELLEDLQEDPSTATLSFSEVAERLELPDFSNGRDNPLLLLADLPLPIYLTTSYHNLLEAALRRANKDPKTVICYWDPRLRSISSVFDTDAGYHPDPLKPLVYHLFGFDKYPSSLVITEDDYLDFLVNISQDWDGIPLPVRQALADSSLLLLGYGLRHWDFRVLFRGLVRSSIDQRRPKSVAIQVRAGDEDEANYLKNYLVQEGDFEIYWGETVDFVKELHQGWVGDAGA
jgi:hypothetical protein